ncbi:hypothetical protein AB0D13_12290 [Streptomyces sp. NPDC048430]|uniref:hypothetical protein n=1 Tax=unclassified Streptomyces TaxID=2593676 RepID=UPI0034456596
MPAPGTRWAKSPGAELRAAGRPPSLRPAVACFGHGDPLTTDAASVLLAAAR